MQLPANNCKAIPADSDSDQTPRCPYLANAPSPFCPEHAEEHRALEERERTVTHEADRLLPIVRDMVTEGANAYTRPGDIRKDERVVRLYLESLEGQVGAAVALKTRFFSEAEDRGSKSLAVLEERKRRVVAFLAALQDRVDTLEHEVEKGGAGPPSSPEGQAAVPVPLPAPTAVAKADEPPARPILDVPHPPCACTATSSLSDSRPGLHSPPGRCTALRLRDGERCTWTCVSGQRFCPIHCVAHGTVVFSHKVKEGALEAQRMRVARGEGDAARRIADVKAYVDKLDEMTGVVEEHQRLFSCRCEFQGLSRVGTRCVESVGADCDCAPRSVRTWTWTAPGRHAKLLKDLGKRRTGAGLLLGELSGRTDAKIAEDQGQAETWATEFLAEVKHTDEAERRKAADDLLTGAVVGGALVWFGVPWARSAVAGVASAFVVRKARDGVDES